MKLSKKKRSKYKKRIILNIFIIKIYINNVITFLSCKSSCKMTMPCKLIGWMKGSCKSHFYAIANATCYHVLLFAIEILCNLTNYSHMWHLRLKNS